MKEFKLILLALAVLALSSPFWLAGHFWPNLYTLASVITFIGSLLLVIAIAQNVMPVVKEASEIQVQKDQLHLARSTQSLQKQIELGKLALEQKKIDLEVTKHRDTVNLKWAMLSNGLQTGYQVELHDAGKIFTHAAPSVKIQEIKEEQRLLEAGPPPPSDLSDLQGIWTPSPNRLLLALNSQGLVTVPLDKSWHIALAGPTGGGKSNTLRLLMMQLSLFHPTYFISPAYAPMKADGTDWKPIADRLAAEPARKANEIEYTFKWLLAELERREDAEQSGDFSWAQKPIYVVIDETKEVFNRFPEGPDYVCALLRRARQYMIFVIMAAQDMLIKNIGGDSGARECYRTSYYFGGDQTTARALLDVRGSVDETGLGIDGLVLLRSLTSPKPEHSRVPLVSNEGLYTFMNNQPSFNRHMEDAYQYSAVHSTSSRYEPNLANRVIVDEYMDIMNEPLKPVERTMNIQVTEAERSAILAAARMQKQETGRIVRTKVRDVLGWNNAAFPKIKQVLDEEGL